MKSQFNLIYILMNLDNFDVAYEIQKSVFPEDPDYEDLHEKAVNTLDDNCFFLVYDNEKLIGLTGVDVWREYPDTIWLDWFTILPEYRLKGYGYKVLLDTIEYCKSLDKYKYFRVETTTYENQTALELYDDVMQTKEEYTIEDTEDDKMHTLIYSYALKGELELWNNKYLGLREYYENCK